MILKTYQEKMPQYIKRIDKLEESFFYTKERSNAQGRRVKIKDKLPLKEVMMKAFEKRVEVLEGNAGLRSWGRLLVLF